MVQTQENMKHRLIPTADMKYSTLNSGFRKKFEKIRIRIRISNLVHNFPFQSSECPLPFTLTFHMSFIGEKKTRKASTKKVHLFIFM